MTTLRVSKDAGVELGLGFLRAIVSVTLCGFWRWILFIYSQKHGKSPVLRKSPKFNRPIA